MGNRIFCPLRGHLLREQGEQLFIRHFNYASFDMSRLHKSHSDQSDIFFHVRVIQQRGPNEQIKFTMQF